jgi:hypothetical protein
MSEHFKIGDKIYFKNSMVICTVIGKKDGFVQVETLYGFKQWCKRSQITKLKESK